MSRRRPLRNAECHFRLLDHNTRAHIPLRCVYQTKPRGGRREHQQQAILCSHRDIQASCQAIGDRSYSDDASQCWAETDDCSGNWSKCIVRRGRAVQLRGDRYSGANQRLRRSGAKVTGNRGDDTSPWHREGVIPIYSRPTRQIDRVTDRDPVHGITEPDQSTGSAQATYNSRHRNWSP